MNNIFSWSRVGNLLRWHFMAGRMQMIKGLLIGVVILSSVALFMSYALLNEQDPAVMLFKYSQNMQFICVTVFSLVIFFGPSLIVRGISNKAQRSTFMMLPASQLEKFVVRYLIVSVGFVVAFFTVVVVVDLLSMFINSLIHNVYFDSFTWELINLVGAITIALSDNSDDVIFFCVSFFYLHSIALLCGVIWRYYQIVITGLVYLLGLLAFDTFELWRLLPNDFDNDRVSAIIFVTLCITFGVLHFILAYRVFCRMKLAGRKWLNV